MQDPPITIYPEDGKSAARNPQPKGPLTKSPHSKFQLFFYYDA